MADHTRTDTGEGLPDLPESKFCAWLQHGKPVNAFKHGAGDRATWDRDGYWSAKGFDRAPLYTAEQVRQAQREGRADAEAQRNRDFHRWEQTANTYRYRAEKAEAEIAALRAQQPAPLQQPLTEAKIEMLWSKHADTARPGSRRLAFARAIEAELASRGAAQGRNTSKELLCGKCGADRLKSPCGNPQDCGMVGAAQALDMSNGPQSIDSPEFREYVRKCSTTWDTYEWDTHLGDLISYIDAWAARRARKGAAMQELVDDTMDHAQLQALGQHQKGESQ